MNSTSLQRRRRGGPQRGSNIACSLLSCFALRQCFASKSSLQPRRSLRHHHLDELLVVDLPVAVDVRLADHLVDLLVRELLAQVRHDVAKLGRTDEAVAVAVEDLEGLDQLLLGVRVLHLARHEG
eukprot:CAMPEP_0204533936 /NCGR_PEP_ID=MMETSP0661-20131031/12586_1 /ASSEMBLY_ACC=CAM_ASM_000606 /TAXON_ID=109239 /ORGANISM="Alexandrium margalefi, Strain AMGDE01CS-322" /LENGTH=124 /DNA_ID=CAMNT_0051540357 /DNA_START=83 /DNA_END=454 /DNA_ORIENTATION=+